MVNLTLGNTTQRTEFVRRSDAGRILQESLFRRFQEAVVIEPVPPTDLTTPCFQENFVYLACWHYVGFGLRCKETFPAVFELLCQEQEEGERPQKSLALGRLAPERSSSEADPGEAHHWSFTPKIVTLYCNCLIEDTVSSPTCSTGIDATMGLSDSFQTAPNHNILQLELIGVSCLSVLRMRSPSSRQDFHERSRPKGS